VRFQNNPIVREELRRNCGWGIALGILISILGLLALANPILTAIAATLIFGWLFVVGGVFRIVYAFQTRQAGHFELKAFVGILSLVAGLLLVTNIVQGVQTLTLILGLSIFFQGVVQTFLAFQIRPAPSWGWILFGGILSVILGILIGAQWPSSARWAIGLLVGVTLLFDGAWIALFSLATRRTLDRSSRS